jgi:hypothetical protein
MLRPFISYYGSKHRIGKLYPAPRYKTVNEVFAGGAGYSLHHPTHRVNLYDLNPVICGIWNYLIAVKEEEIRALPLKVVDLTDMPIPQEAKWLIGFWLSKASARPVTKPSAWMEKEKRMSRGYWSKLVRSRIANQLKFIRHWKVHNKSYTEAPNREATWYVDPPYMGNRGKVYKFHEINYPALGEWCLSRKGQVIACEGPDGNWLPFRRLTEHKSAIPDKVTGKAIFGKEVIYHRSDKSEGFGFY